MPQKVFELKNVDTRWKDLYWLGGIFSILIAVSIVLAIIAYFIWPFKPGLTSTENIFSALQANLFGGLMSLDLALLVIGLINILPLLALYIALKQVNESYALIALILGLISVSALIPSRPLVELVSLSDKFATATSESERIPYLAAGESLHSLFNGTAWMIYTILGNISTLISCALILQSNIFRKALAYVGIVSAISGLGVFIPTIGPIVSLLATFGGVIWSVMIACDFFRLSKA
jgi:hypothetical protein